MAEEGDEVLREALSHYLRAEMARCDISFPDLARRLGEETGQEWERTALFNKIKRASFSATFLLQLFAALDIHEQLRERIYAHLPSQGRAR